MGDLESGIYAIVNVVCRNCPAVDKPDDANSSLIASAYPDRKLSQWKVTRLPNETYTLANVASGRFAAAHELKQDSMLSCSDSEYQFIITPVSRKRNQISTTGRPRFHWGFASDSQMALVELDNNPENRNNWWTFKPQQPAAPAIPGQVAELPTTTTEKVIAKGAAEMVPGTAKSVESPQPSVVVIDVDGRNLSNLKRQELPQPRPEVKHTYMETKEVRTENLQQEIGEELELDEGEELGMELDNGEELDEEDEEPTLDVGNEEEEDEDDYYSSITWKFWPAACARDLDNAIVGGKDARGNDIFVARAKYKKYFQDGIYPGSIVRNFIYFSYAGEECQIPTRLNVAEVLWGAQSSVCWVPVRGELSVEKLGRAKPVCGGETVDGRPLFISRSRLEGIPGLYVGKVELKKLGSVKDMQLTNRFLHDPPPRKFWSDK
ncbi:hypothetical protein BDP27DRAFT_1364861 [Rhodocollybia butyracea]|uniref:Uncharacterized protein n=1 Tax=Rhodocollybia butyracea TaxID=206335 RepID=A0A9P5PKY9_9AGAR|nr:hypothetical protein BDP27DRAFT_1364861 [Rhodocollybia butyracea]